MAEISKSQGKDSPVSPVRSIDGQGRPESPTTAQPLDFDDDLDAQTPTKPTESTNAPRPPPKDEVPPAKPPRPVNAKEQAENTLKEAFPTIDASVIRAVLAASGGQVEPAFNALLGMTDPDSQREPEPPARPPRPVRETSTQQSQLEADEMYARQLHEHYANTERSRQQPQDGYEYNQNLQGSRQGRPGYQGGNPNNPNNPEDRSEWRSFIDDDLPEIRDNIRKGFLETQSTVNRWITSFKKTIDGETDDDVHKTQPQSGQGLSRPNQQQQQQQQPQSYHQSYRRSSEMRRSQDLARYDADPQVIGDDFSKLELRDADGTSGTATSTRNRTKSPGSGRKVSFQDGPPEEIGDMYSATSKPSTTTTTGITAPTTIDNSTTSTTRASKWQPLSKAEPSPVAENDPFSLGDSDDEKDAKPISLEDNETDDTNERLRKAMSEATEDSIGGKPDTKK